MGCLISHHSGFAEGQQPSMLAQSLAEQVVRSAAPVLADFSKVVPQDPSTQMNVRRMRFGWQLWQPPWVRWVQVREHAQVVPVT